VNKSKSSNSISASTKLLALSALTELGYFIKHLEKSDSVAVNDEQIRVFVKNLIENVSVEENAALAFTMGTLTENVNVLDTFAKVVSYNRNFNDAFTLDDAALIDKDYYGNKGNVAFMLDILGLSTAKIATDTVTVGDLVGLLYNKYVNEVISLSEYVTSDVIKIVEEVASLTDVASLTLGIHKADSVSTPDASYFASGLNKSDSVTPTEVFGVAATLIKVDSATISEVYVNSFNKYVTDGIALDDAALIDKNYYGNKGNVATMSDELSISYGFARYFNDSISLSDVENNPVGTGVLNTSLFNPGNSQFALYRGNDQVDTFGISDVAAIGPSKVFADNLSLLASAFSDTSYYGLGKNPSDSANLTDSIWLSLKTFTDTANIAEILANNFSKTLDESSDIINISDTINLARVTGGVMNAIPLNRVQLN
jgi:hypothetical protein